jgi:hypothetical protein
VVEVLLNVRPGYFGPTAALAAAQGIRNADNLPSPPTLAQAGGGQ